MAQLRDVMAYLCARYPHKNELSKARLTKMVYLADWRAAITRNAQITSISWIYNYYGPYVDDVTDVARDDPGFEVIHTANMYGGYKEIIRYVGNEDWHSLTGSDIKVLDYVIEMTAPMYWDQFIELVYSTFPITKMPRFAPLNLVALAREYGAQPSLASADPLR